MNTRNLRRMIATGMMGGKKQYWKKVRATNPIQFIPLFDAVGATSAKDESGNGLNGTPTNVTFGADGIGDGKTGGTFNAVSSVIDIYSSTLNTNFPKMAGWVKIYFKVASAGVWTDGTGRRTVTITQDINNRLYISKSGTSNIVEVVFIANSINKTVNINCNLTDWVCIDLTWSVANDRMRAYINGVQSGVDQTSIGTWAAGNLLTAECVLGARTKTGENWFSGDLAYYALRNYEPTPAEVAADFFNSVAEAPLGFSDDKIRFIWQTDTHVQAGVSVQNSLNVTAAIADVNTWLPNAYVHTGDIGDNYVQHVREAFTYLHTCRRPVIACNGNHDEEEVTLGIGNPNTLPLTGAQLFNRSAPFYYSTRMTSGDRTVKALCLILDNNIYDDDPNHITDSPNHAPGYRFGWTETKTDWWKRFNPDCLSWVASTLATNSDCQMVLVFVHSPPAGMTFTNYAALIDLFQSDGRPTMGFSGHVHADATRYDGISTDTLLTVPFYKAPGALDSHAWTRVTLSMSEGAIVIDEMLVKNYTDPGGWTINAPFTLPV